MTNNSLLVPSDTSEIVLYQPNQEIRLEVRLDDETVWLTQAQMAILFKTTPQNVTLHIRNIYKEGELEAGATCKDYLQVREEGRRTVQRIQKFYNLDVIISVGYRVKSIHGIRFRQWANSSTPSNSVLHSMAAPSNSALIHLASTTVSSSSTPPSIILVPVLGPWSPPLRFHTYGSKS